MTPILHKNFGELPWKAGSPFRVSPNPGGFDTASIEVLVDGGPEQLAILFGAGKPFLGDGVRIAGHPQMYSTGPEPGSVETVWGIEPGSDTLTACTSATIGYKGFLEGGSVWYGQDVIVTYAKTTREIMFPQDTEGYILYGASNLEPVGGSPGQTNATNRFLRNRPGTLPPAPFHVRVLADVYTASVQGVWKGGAVVPKQAPFITLDQPPAEPTVNWANVPDPLYCQQTGWQEMSFDITSEFKAGSVHLALWRASFEYVRPRALA